MTAETVIVFRLYVAGDLPNSRRARANLERYCREHLPERHRIEVLDVFAAPDRALEDRVLLTPQLVVSHPAGSNTLVGDLSDLSSLSVFVEPAADDRP